MFDLDGTLLQISQELFLGTYLPELGKVFARLNLDVEACVKAVWAGTKAMALNDGSMLNADRFWTTFADHIGLPGEKLRDVEAACNAFYMNEFAVVKSVMTPNDISGRLVRALKAGGYTIVLATNPLFPACAVDTRLSWIGLAPDDFILITHYANSTYCKPNLGYYREIFGKINKEPRQCLMAGNNPSDDMSAGALGAETYLITDYLENESGMDIERFRRGTLAELESYLMSLPAPNIRLSLAELQFGK
jgi:FMN phosphatase YigB (HAD superfamily)